VIKRVCNVNAPENKLSENKLFGGECMKNSNNPQNKTPPMRNNMPPPLTISPKKYLKSEIICTYQTPQFKNEMLLPANCMKVNE